MFDWNKDSEKELKRMPYRAGERIDSRANTAKDETIFEEREVDMLDQKHGGKIRMYDLAALSIAAVWLCILVFWVYGMVTKWDPSQVGLQIVEMIVGSIIAVIAYKYLKHGKERESEALAINKGFVMTRTERAQKHMGVDEAAARVVATEVKIESDQKKGEFFEEMIEEIKKDPVLQHDFTKAAIKGYTGNNTEDEMP